MNIYSRLLRLYRTNMAKTPLEDFTTEILAGILTSFPEIGSAFVNHFLKVEGGDFSFTTQEHFDSIDPTHPDCRVDLVIRNENIVCFIEFKVEAREGYIQLDRYARVLDRLQTESVTYLKYCTKYFDSKDIADHQFQQFRWADIYRFLTPWKSSDIIFHFLTFLNDHNMSDNMDFTINDLLALQGLNEAVGKMDRYLEKIRPVFGRHFGAGRIKDSQNLRQIKNHSRFVFNADQIFGEGGYCELGVGFDFTSMPSLKVWIWVSDRNSMALSFKQALKDTNLNTNGENWLGCTGPLSDYISAETMEQEIEQWFDNAFLEIKNFKAIHPELNWNI